MKVLDVITAILLIVGGLNWGLVAVFNFNLVAAIFGATSVASRFVYLLVAVSAIYQLFEWRAVRRRSALA